jgi:hypothetical protein
MKSFLVFALICTSFSAFAECFTFKNGQGPYKLGGATLKRTAKIMCVNTTLKYSNVEFGDNKGEVAVAEATIRRERQPYGEVVADLAMANVNGLAEDLRGVSVTIKRGRKDAAREVVIGNKTYFAIAE